VEGLVHWCNHWEVEGPGRVGDPVPWDMALQQS